MPLIGIVIGGIDFSSLSVTVGEAKITYGNFIQNENDFLIIAACIFLVVKFIERFTKKQEAKQEPAPEVKDEKVLLLEEIRDLLKKETKV